MTEGFNFLFLNVLEPGNLTFYAAILSAIVLFYWLTPSQGRQVYLALISTLILLTLDWVSYLVLLAIGLLTFALTKINHRSTPVLLLGLALLILPFAAHETARVIFRTSDHYDLVFMTGMAFYSLRLIHYWFEHFKGQLPKHSFVNYYSYLFFFPIIIVGPIYRFEDYMKSTRRQRFDTKNIRAGIDRIALGGFQVVVVSDIVISQYFNAWILNNTDDASLTRFYFESIEFGLNVYYQFAGYSNLAIGVGLLIGYKICENFNFPLFRPNIVEFWKNWHMSLTGWVRSYIYLPIVSYTNAPRLALLLSMSTIGVWHGFTINAVMWGLYNGIGINLYHYFKETRIRSFLVNGNPIIAKAWWVFSSLFTFNYVMIGVSFLR